MDLASSWFTGTRLNRLVQALREIPGQKPGIPGDVAARAVWRSCGGPFDEIPIVLEVIRALDLFAAGEESLTRSRLGNQIVKAAVKGDLTQLGLLLIRAGWFHDQARVLVEQGSVDLNGALTCGFKQASSGAPQLVGVLSWWVEVEIRPVLRVPASLVAELNTIWALLPPATVLPTSLAERKAVGDRAEMYTVQFERSRTSSPSSIHWVSRDSDLLGWDVEDRTQSGLRCIEVKGRRDGTPTFFFSENEYRKAEELGEAYEVHFWGGIDLGRTPAVEYAVLRAAGYPLRLAHFSALVRQGAWVMTPVRWKVTAAPSQEATLSE